MGSRCFVVCRLCAVLSSYLRSSNFSSFVRQLNYYGFHKQTHVREHGTVYEFTHDKFQRDAPELAADIRRRTVPESGSTPEDAVSLRAENDKLRARISSLQHDLAESRGLVESTRKRLGAVEVRAGAQSAATPSQPTALKRLRATAEVVEGTAGSPGFRDLYEGLVDVTGSYDDMMASLPPSLPSIRTPRSVEGEDGAMVTTPMGVDLSLFDGLDGLDTSEFDLDMMAPPSPHPVAPSEKRVGSSAFPVLVPWSDAVLPVNVKPCGPATPCDALPVVSVREAAAGHGSAPIPPPAVKVEDGDGSMGAVTAGLTRAQVSAAAWAHTLSPFTLPLWLPAANPVVL